MTHVCLHQLPELLPERSTAMGRYNKPYKNICSNSVELLHCRWLDCRWTDKQTDSKTDGRMEGQIDRQTEKQEGRHNTDILSSAEDSRQGR